MCTFFRLQVIVVTINFLSDFIVAERIDPLSAITLTKFASNPCMVVCFVHLIGEIMTAEIDDYLVCFFGFQRCINSCGSLTLKTVLG